MTTYDTYELWLEDTHDRREHDDWLTEVEYTSTPLPEPPPTPQPITVCRDCGETMHVYNQSCVRGKPPVRLAECKNVNCDLLDVTLSARKWSTITESELDAYRAVVRGLKAVAS